MSIWEEMAEQQKKLTEAQEKLMQAYLEQVRKDSARLDQILKELEDINIKLSK